MLGRLIIRRRFCSEGPSLHDMIERRLAAAKDRGNKIELRTVKLPEEFWINSGFKKSIQGQDLKILSVPSDTDALTHHDHYSYIMNQLSSLKRPVLAPLDPTKYIFQKRRITNHFDDKLRNAHNPKLSEDPIWHRNIDEVRYDNTTMNHYYKAFVKTVEDAQEITSLDDLDKKEKKLDDELFVNELQKLTPETSVRTREKAKIALAECFNELFFWQGAPVYGSNMYTILNSLLISAPGSVYCWYPSQLLYRLILGSVMSTDDLMTDFLESVETFAKLKKSTEFGLEESLEVFVRRSLYDKFSQHTCYYGVAFLEDFVYQTQTVPTIVADDFMAATIETLLLDKYDETVRYSEFQNLQAITDDDMREELVKIHAMADMSFDTRIWDEPYVSHAFPYIRLRGKDMTDIELKECQRLYFMAYKKLQAFKNKVVRSVEGNAGKAVKAGRARKSKQDKFKSDVLGRDQIEDIITIQ